MGPRVTDPALVDFAGPKYRHIFEAVAAHGSVRAAEMANGLSNDTYGKIIRRLIGAMQKAEVSRQVKAAERTPYADPLPPDDVPIEQILDMMTQRFVQRQAHVEAQRWRRFKIPVAGPYALLFMGDPHVDDNGTNIPLLREHCAMAAQTPGVYAVNIGDVSNNWAGRLAALWQNQDTSASTARRLVKWLMHDSGVPWFLWLTGNHDAWPGPVGSEWIDAIKPHHVAMADWGAKVTLVSPCGHELRLWAQHNFKGTSIWNNMHGLERAAQMRDWAHIYVAGHHHDFGIREGENAERGFIYNLVRARGYKFIDSHADVHDFPSYRYGASVLAVISPGAGKANVVKCFSDPMEGAEFLAWKRAKVAA